MSDWLTAPELKRLYEVGKTCSLLGQKTEDMDRAELIAFIGHLNEIVKIHKAGFDGIRDDLISLQDRMREDKQ